MIFQKFHIILKQKVFIKKSILRRLNLTQTPIFPNAYWLIFLKNLNLKFSKERDDCHVIKQYDGTLVIKIQHILTKNECRRSDKNSRNSTCAKIKCCYIIKDGKGLWDDINSLFTIRLHFHKIFKYFSKKKKKTHKTPPNLILPQNESEDQFYTSILL